MINNIVGSDYSLVNDKFRSDVKYNRKLPEMFTTDDINAASENITFAILGELRDRSNGGEPVSFTYQELAELGGLWITRKNGSLELYSGKRLQKLMYELNDALRNFSYTKIRELNEDGTPKSWKTVNIFSMIDFDGSNKEVKLTVSNAEIEPGKIDSTGTVIEKPLRVLDLINSNDWSKVKYLQYSRVINNELDSKYSKRLYRYISEYRTFPRGTKISIDDFDKNIFKILKTKDESYKGGEVFDKRKNRKKYLDIAIQEISDLKSASGEQIIKNLNYIFNKSGRKIISIEFIFSPFKEDLTSRKEIIHKKNVKTFKRGNSNDLEAQGVIDYLNYLWSINFNETSSGFLKHIKINPIVIFEKDSPNIMNYVYNLLEAGYNSCDLMQVAEMKAIDWKFKSPSMSGNLKPSVLFGNKFEEYKAFVDVFIMENSNYFMLDTPQDDFYIPMESIWDI